MAERSILLLRLEGPMQAWGEHSYWDDRDSADLPTKSGIVGLIACAMGLERSDPRISQISNQISFSVRADRAGYHMIDFQTVMGMHPTKNGPKLMNAEGKPRGDNFISRRDYIQDASFLVAVGAEKKLISEMIAALKNPKWCIYLGRKNCVPTRPVFEAETQDYSDVRDAIQSWPFIPGADDTILYECEIEGDENVVLSRSDERIEGHRNFSRRTVYRGVLSGEKEDVLNEN